MNQTIAYVAVGSNLGQPRQNVDRAIAKVRNLNRVRLVATSSLQKTAPWGNVDQPDFVNGVVAVETSLPATALLEALQQIENNMGRVRHEKWGPRIIDLDIVLFGSELIDTPVLTVPHPHMLERAFVLEPLLELAPDLVHPVSGMLLKDALERLHGQQRA